MNGEESELANQVSDPGMIASRDGMRARDPWEMEQRRKKPRSRDALSADIADELEHLLSEVSVELFNLSDAANPVRVRVQKMRSRIEEADLCP